MDVETVWFLNLIFHCLRINFSENNHYSKVYKNATFNKYPNTFINIETLKPTDIEQDQCGNIIIRNRMCRLQNKTHKDYNNYYHNYNIILAGMLGRLN